MTARKWADTDKGAAAGGAKPAETRNWADTERGRAQAAKASAQSGGGSATRWVPKVHEGGAGRGAEASTSAGGPRILPALALKAGTRAELRQRLEVALAAGSVFLLALFDGLFHEGPAAVAPAAAPEPKPEEKSALNAAALGLEVVQLELPGGVSALQVIAVGRQSPAGKAGLEVGDLVDQVDESRPSSPAELDAAVGAGLWKNHLFYVRRGGEPKRVSVESPV